MSTTPTRKQLLEALQYEGRNESRLSIMFRDAVAAQMGLNVTDAECLDFLLEAGSATAGELARMTGLSPSATTSAIDRLEKACYVQRKADPSDRRRVVVEPVMKNLQKGHEFYQRFVNAADKVFDSLSDDELKAIVKYLKGMNEVYLDQLDQIGKH
jgi:DNA-binding MarR family transcriptional regulator